MRDPLYKKLRGIQRGMKTRCYNPNNPAYKWYGAIGVRVCEEWLGIEGFLRTIDSVDGWNEEKFLKGELDLDKDFKVPGNKLYSPETCCFVDKLKNSTYRPNAMQEVIGLSPEDKLHSFTNIAQFAKTHNFHKANIAKAAKINDMAYGWVFTYKSSRKDIYLLKQELLSERRKFVLTKEGKTPLEFQYSTEAAEFIGVSRYTAEIMLRAGKTHNGWRLHRKV